MPKVTMIWEMPGDHQDFLDAYNGWRWKMIVSELDEWLRRKIKYEDSNELQEVRDKLHEIKSGDGLNLWD